MLANVKIEQDKKISIYTGYLLMGRRLTEFELLIFV